MIERKLLRVVICIAPQKMSGGKSKTKTSVDTAGGRERLA
jgi:hypothetical protein